MYVYTVAECHAPVVKKAIGDYCKVWNELLNSSDMLLVQNLADK